MPLDRAELWHLLHALDEPDHLEFPAGYDHGRVRARFELLVQRLDVAFHRRCEVDRDVQDASLHGRIEVPAAASATGRPLVVSVSNFSPLAVLSVDNPGTWTDAEAATLLHPGDAQQIHTALTDLGYLCIPEEWLWEPYDGVCDPDIFGPSGATWWVRYFDYL